MSKIKVVTMKQAIDSFLLSCKVEGKSYGTIECYSDKLKGFLWYATNYDCPDIPMVNMGIISLKGTSHFCGRALQLSFARL